MNLTRRVGFVALALAGLLAPMLARHAGADIKVKVQGNNTATSTMKFVIENIQNPGPCGPYINEALWLPGTGQVSHYCVGLTDPASNKAVGQARYDGVTASSAAWVFGNASLGGENQIETLPDSLVSGIGLYQAPGGTALGSNPDSLLRVNITRSSGLVTLTVPTIVVGGVSVGSGGMQVRAANPNETSIAELRVIVYQNQAAADADVNSDGFGSAFFGKAVLETGAGVPTGLSTYGGFTNADFIVQNQGGGKYTLRPIAGLTRNVAVTNSSDAVVVLVGDPRTVSRPVPGQSTAGLALLALAMMATGLWVMRSRRRAESV